MSDEFGKYSNKAVVDFQIRNQLITKLKNRFSTYNYQQVRTSTFEDYDMYSTITKTVNKDEMIKVIDSTGKVLVLRPDGTIPITRMTALNTEINNKEQRLFYVLDVFRHSDEDSTEKESTQAGVELFGNKTPESDAEVITLAIHTLKDIGFRNFKIEIGHAGFFKELLEQADLNPNELQTLQEFIQSKNLVEMEPFLENLQISPELQQDFLSIPLLYGNPREVLKQTETIIRNDKMQDILDNLMHVIDVLEDYGMDDFITLNLGLINDMYYYTDIIFQGFVGNIGKPVLMGGRYDHLGEQFGKEMAAIGFAYEVDFLLAAMQQHQLTERVKETTPIQVTYETQKRRGALETAQTLRDKGFVVITSPINSKSKQVEISFTENKNSVKVNGKEQAFYTIEELIALLPKEVEVPISGDINNRPS